VKYLGCQSVELAALELVATSATPAPIATAAGAALATLRKNARRPGQIPTSFMQMLRFGLRDGQCRKFEIQIPIFLGICLS
jgi:hypothetical protein